MKKQTLRTKINGKYVRGLGHLQPGNNPWIGVFVVSKDFLAANPDDWKGSIIDYEGPFNYEGECKNGKGKGKITHLRKDGNKFIINVEGVGEAELEEPMNKRIRFSYNQNLPTYINLRKAPRP